MDADGDAGGDVGGGYAQRDAASTGRELGDGPKMALALLGILAVLFFLLVLASYL